MARSRPENSVIAFEKWLVTRLIWDFSFHSEGKKEAGKKMLKNISKRGKKKVFRMLGGGKKTKKPRFLLRGKKHDFSYRRERREINENSPFFPLFSVISDLRSSLFLSGVIFFSSRICILKEE